MEKALILGECKGSPSEMSAEVLEKLVEKTAAVVPQQGQWWVLHVGLARGGWTAEAQTLAQQTAGLQGENWVASSAVLVDLEQVDADLTNWL